ncbi:unnamed protein product [Brassicogethes aeneus]|uniref:Uncharacterized protein n=1 Tax=Brassicogethes aeneus TaxID=1431903 RepID=A0A9P0B2C1_BRAAE|nr:unnamed protein product [Brassicogethes aeneus]
MSSRRRSRSRDRKNAASKLRMDTKPMSARITDPSLPAGRRREIDNVMKKARAQTSPTANEFWSKKLLEVEAKDPNRYVLLNCIRIFSFQRHFDLIKFTIRTTRSISFRRILKFTKLGNPLRRH